MSGFVLPSDSDPTPGAGGSAPQGSSGPFTLPSDADDATAAATTPSTLSDVSKAVPSGLAVGTAAAAGTPGGILDAIGNGGEWLIQRGLNAVGALPSGTQPQSYSDIAASNRALTKGTDILPRTEDVLQAAHDDAGFTPYQPKTVTGQFLGKTAEFLPSALVGPGGLAAKGAMAAGSAAGDMAAGAVFDGTPYETTAHVAGSLIGGGVAPLVVHGYQKLAPAWSDAAAKANAAGLVLDAAHDPAALQANVAADTGSGELVAGSKPTSFQSYGDVGLGDLERAVNTRDPQKFVSNPYGTGTQEQNAAQVAAMQGVQQGGDSMSVPALFMRQLEELRAAINHHRREGLCSQLVEVVLPPKGGSRERWLTRSEAARLLWAAYRYREIQKGIETDKRSRRHIARFVLVALYTGTRAAAICGACFEPGQGRGWIDLEAGVFYRRGEGVRETKKRTPPIRIPDRLLAHLRRWKAHGISLNFVVEFGGEPVSRITKAFNASARAAGLNGAYHAEDHLPADKRKAKRDVTPHVLRHTAVTWAMQNRAEPEEADGYFGMTAETRRRVYQHHHPDHQKGVAAAVTRSPGAQKVHRYGPNETARNAPETALVAELHQGKAK